MSHLFICDADGQILRTVTCPDSMDSVQEQPGETARAVAPGVTLETHYWAGTAFAEYGASPGEFYAWDWTAHAWTLPASALDAAKAKQSDILNAACRAAIYEGFDSDALGTVHHYPAKEQDQSNLVASVTASFYPSLPVDWVTPFWCSNADGVWNYALHSAAQIQHAGADGKAAILAQLIHNEGLQQQVKDAVSIAEVQAVVW